MIKIQIEGEAREIADLVRELVNSPNDQPQENDASDIVHSIQERFGKEHINTSI